MRRWADRALDLFNDWFSSPPGVWHTLIIVAVLVAFEFAFPRMDRSMFMLMAWLTIYSAVTQPALAYSGRRSSDKLDALIETLEARVERIEAHLGIKAP